MTVNDSLFAFSRSIVTYPDPGLDTALILRTACAEGGKRFFTLRLALMLAVFMGAH